MYKGKSGPVALGKKYFFADKKGLLLLTLFFLLGMVFQLLAPWFLGRFIDAAQGNGGIQVLLSILLYFITILLGSIMTALVSYRSQALGCKITDTCRRDVLDQYLRISMKEHDNWQSGDVMTRLDEDPQGLFQYYYILFFKLGASGLTLVGVLAVLFFQSVLLGGIMLLVSILSILLFKWIQDRGVVKYVRSAAASAAFNGTMKELVDNAVALRALDAVDYGETALKTAMHQRYKENFPASLNYFNGQRPDCRRGHLRIHVLRKRGISCHSFLI